MGKIKTTGPLEIDASSAIEINSSGGTIDIGNDAVAQDITIGVGLAARTIKIGNTTAATGVDIGIGTGDFSISSASGTLVSQLDTGEMTKPLQPAFLATLTTSDNNITGGGATYVLGTNVALTEVFDQGSDFNTNGTFTAPVTGRYEFICGLRFGQLAAAMTVGQFRFITSNRTYKTLNNPGVSKTTNNDFSVLQTVITDMDASDTVTVDMGIFNGAGNTADLSDDLGESTYFSGCLLV